MAASSAACDFGNGERDALVALPDDPTWQTGIADLMAAYCNECHGESPVDTTLGYFRTDVYEDSGGVAGAYTLRQRLVERVLDHGQPMPPPPDAPMSPAEVDGLRRWVEQGAPLRPGDSGAPAVAGCEPATVVECACPGGAVAEQVCRADQTWGPCACTGGVAAGPLDGVWTGVLLPSCVAGTCHAAGAAYPDLETRAGLYERLLSPSVQAPGMALVEPGFLDGSYLYQKIRADFSTLGIGSGNRMPTGPALPAAQADIVRTWIESGAPE